MKCLKCQHVNEGAARFCEQCGSLLSRTCVRCGQQLSTTARFCSGCGHPTGLSAKTQQADIERSPFGSPETYTPKHLAQKILNSRAALEGERKQVTVLFADLKASMELLADRDPEEARSLLDPILELMMDAVHHYEGTVSLAMGDGIMAIFGAPLAHEDHAVRACYAALRMQELVKRHAESIVRTHGEKVQIRVGLNSGEVVVRAIASDLHMDYTAIGRTTHLAARMEQLASPGSIFLTPSTLELVNGFVTVRSIGVVPIKGLADAMEVYEVTGTGSEHSQLQAVARRRLTRFLGRDAELQELSRARQLTFDGRGQVIELVAEPGVGKTRLVYEFSRSQELQGWLILTCAAVSYGKAMSYLPVIDLLKSHFEIQSLDNLQAVGDKVKSKLVAFDVTPESALPALLTLLDVPMEPLVGSERTAEWMALAPGRRRQNILDALRQLLMCVARKQPLLLIFEDLHWVDGETQTLLDNLVESIGSARILLLMTYRLEYRHDWGSKTRYRRMQLDALSAGRTMELLDDLLGNETVLRPLKQLLTKRGNPFFLEETVRTLVETKALDGAPGQYRLTRPVHSIQVPATVQVVLAARIDRLPPDEKRLLHVASVIGRQVPFSLLRMVAEMPEETLRDGLNHLQAAEFIYETGVAPDLEYIFKHALTHDVAYGSLLHERRCEIHANIVSAIETLHANRLGEHIEQLAYHALRGELRERAVSYLRQAAQKSADRSALQDAKAWFEQALSVLDALPESRAVLGLAFEIRLELQQILMQLSEARQMLQRLHEAEVLAERLNDDRQRVRTCSFLASLHSLLGDLDKSFATGTRALEIAGRVGDWKLHLLATTFLAQAHYLHGDYNQAVELNLHNITTMPTDLRYERLEVTTSASVYNRYWLNLSLAQRGLFAEAIGYGAEAIQLASPTRHPMAVGLAHFAASMPQLLRGDWAKARPLLEHGMAALRTGNVAIILPYAIAESAWVLAQLNEVRGAVDAIHEAEPLLRRQAETGYISQCSWAYHSLGRASLLLGRHVEAWRLAGRAVELAPHHPGFAAHALNLLGDVATHPDRFDAERGEAYYRKELALAEPRGMRPLIAHCHLGFGKLYQRIGKPEQALEHLTIAACMYREMEMHFYLVQAEAAAAPAALDLRPRLRRNSSIGTDFVAVLSASGLGCVKTRRCSMFRQAPFRCRWSQGDLDLNRSEKNHSRHVLKMELYDVLHDWTQYTDVVAWQLIVRMRLFRSD